MKFTSLFGFALVASFLTGCGGGGGGNTLPPLSEGAYMGTSTGSNPNFFLLRLENQEIWSMSGTLSGNIFFINRFRQGQSTSNNGVFSVSNAKDFRDTPAIDAPSTGTYTASNTFTATTTISGTSVTSTGSPVTNSLYNYNTAAQLSDFAGPWTVNDLQGNTNSLTIAAGNIAGSITSGPNSGCTYTGTLTPRSSGKNVMDVVLSYDPIAACAATDQGVSFTGIALTYMATGTVRQFLLGSINAGRTAGHALVGTR